MIQKYNSFPVQLRAEVQPERVRAEMESPGRFAVPNIYRAPVVLPAAACAEEVESALAPCSSPWCSRRRRWRDDGVEVRLRVAQ
jgi:hypothetical protein